MDSVERSVLHFALGYSCSQAVLLAFAEQLGITPEVAARVAGAFGGGMGRQGRTCGAVSGALMVLGMTYSSPLPADHPRREQTYDLTRQFLERFRAAHGALDCHELIGIDISTPEGLARARDEGKFQACSQYVQGAAKIVTEMISAEKSVVSAEK